VADSQRGFASTENEIAEYRRSSASHTVGPLITLLERRNITSDRVTTFPGKKSTALGLYECAWSSLASVHSDAAAAAAAAATAVLQQLFTYHTPGCEHSCLARENIHTAFR